MSAGRSNGSHIDSLVTGDPAAARITTEATLFEQQFQLTWHDDWNATAERGSKSGNFLLGGLVKYLKLGLHVMSIGDDQFLVRLEAESPGELCRESMGKRNMDDEFETLRSVLESAFTTAGTLRSVTEG